MPGNRIPEIDSWAEAPAESAFHCPPGPISELQAHRHFSGIPISDPTKATGDNSTPALPRRLKRNAATIPQVLRQHKACKPILHRL